MKFLKFPRNIESSKSFLELADVLDLCNVQYVGCYERLFVDFELLSIFKHDISWMYITNCVLNSLHKTSDQIYFLEKYKDFVNLNYYMINSNVSEEIIEYALVNNFKLDQFHLLSEQSVSFNLVKKHPNLFNWRYASCFVQMSELEMEEYQNKLNWYNISSHQVLNHEFIIKHHKLLNFNSLFENKKSKKEAYIAKLILESRGIQLHLK